jgi:hypothetical protein
MKRTSQLTIALLVLLSVLLPAAWAAPGLNVQPAGVLRAADGGRRHNFGHSITLQGNVAAIGAPGWDNEHGSYTGAVYIFGRAGQNWKELTRLTAADARAYEAYGVMVDLDGDTLAVGASRAARGNYGDPDFAFDAGAIYIYTGSGANWTQQAKLMPAELDDGSDFGGPFALEGDTLLAGAPYHSDDKAAEAVYAYQRVDGAWGTPQKINGSAGNHNFGSAVALAGDVALIGAPGISCCDQWSPFEKGVVYVYTRSGGVWTPAGSFMPDDGIPGDNFGCNIAFDGTTAVIGACQAYGLHELGGIHGYAYIFTRDGATWTQTARLEPEGDAIFPQGIGSLAHHGDRLMLGTTNAPGEPWPGRIYPYRRDGATWTLETPIGPPDGAPDNGFGAAVALDDRFFLAGASSLPLLNVEEQGGVFAWERVYAHHVYAPAVVSD